MGRMQYAPTQVPDSFSFFDFRFFCRVGTQKHTSSKRRWRRRMIIFVHWHASSFPSETFGGAYAIRPYLSTFLFYGFHSCNMVGAQQHTPYECRRRRRMIIFVHWHASSFPSKTFGRRMQYAPTWVHSYFMDSIPVIR